MSTESNRMLLKHHLKKLRLPTIRREWEAAAESCVNDGRNYGDFLLQLTEQELIEREQRAAQRRIKSARSSRCSKPWRTSILAPRHRIKEQMMLFADRVSALARATVATIRLKLIKIGAVIVREASVIRIHLSSHHPLKDLFTHAAARLSPP